jgi:hypothetical protein
MVKLHKYLLLCLVITSIAFSSLIIKQSDAQTISKPSAPEFSYKFSENVYHPTIVINITNQAYPSTINGTEAKLYYNIRTKNHLEENWTNAYVIAPSTLPSQSLTGFTELTYTLDYATGDSVDLQVGALLGYNQYTTYPESPTIRFEHFTTQTSEWSPSITFIMPNNPTPKPTPVQFYLSEDAMFIVIAVIAIAALIIASLSLVRTKTKTKSKEG